MPIYIFVSYQKCQEFLLILAGLHLRLQGVNSKDRSAMHISVACVLLDCVSGLDSLQLSERDTFTPAVCPRSYCTDQFPRLRQETKSVVQKDIVEELIFLLYQFLERFLPIPRNWLKYERLDPLLVFERGYAGQQTGHLLTDLLDVAYGSGALVSIKFELI